MNLVIVSGIPCSGKTTIGKMLARHFDYKFLSKDMYKEELFLRYGFTSIEEKKKLDFMAEETLYHEIENNIARGENMVVDKWLQGMSMLTKIKNISNANIVFIRLITSPIIATQRYNYRNEHGYRPMCFMVKDRFPIIDNENAIFEKRMSVGEMTEKANRPFFKEGIDNLLEIDTTNIEKDSNIIFPRIIAFVEKTITVL